jgi:hypothetical protein
VYNIAGGMNMRIKKFYIDTDEEVINKFLSEVDAINVKLSGDYIIVIYNSSVQKTMNIKDTINE